MAVLLGEFSCYSFLFMEDIVSIFPGFFLCIAWFALLFCNAHVFFDALLPS